MNRPAPLDLGRLEVEAKATAAKHVANLLQRPDQLDRVDQIRRKMARKKASVEAMLKTAVQSQLDGVRTGLNQLNMALQGVREINQCLQEVDESYRAIYPKLEKMKIINTENARYCQLAAAVENWKHIFTVPESVRKTDDLINDGRLLQAHKHLRDLETSRDELLLELHKQSTPSPTDKNTLHHYFGDVQRLSDDLGKQLWMILNRTLISMRREPSIIVTALRIIEREERTDAAYAKQEDLTGFLPPGRPKRWREKCFQVLADSISNRIEANQFEDREDNKMWLVRHLEMTRQLMVEDLRVVKTLLPAAFPPEYDIMRRYVQMYHVALSQHEDLRVVKTLLPAAFPPEYDIMRRYVQMYHVALSQHLLELIARDLEAKEIVNLLTWINSYEGPELLKHPDLQVDTSRLEPLLNSNVMDDLQNLYLKNMKSNVTEWLRNCLTSDVKDWNGATKPDADGSGYLLTSFPVIIFQMMEQNIQVGAMIHEDLVQKILELFVEELNLFALDYKAEIKKYQDKHLEDRSGQKYYIHYLIANINNCQTLGDHMTQLRSRYRRDDYGEKFEGVGQIRKEPINVLVEEFTRIGNFGCECLLQEQFLDLKESKCLLGLFTKQWLESSECVDIICATLLDYNKDFCGLKPQFHETLIQQTETKVITEYLSAIFSKRMSFKNYEERRNGAEKLTDEAHIFKEMFASLAPERAVKTFQAPKKSVFDVLPMIAEVIKMKDTSVISLEITTLVNHHKDIRVEQIVNLLLLRGDVNRSESRQIAMDTLGEDDLRPKPRGLFSDLVTT